MVKPSIRWPGFPWVHGFDTYPYQFGLPVGGGTATFSLVRKRLSVMNAFSVAVLFSGVVALSLQLSAAEGWLTWRGPLGTSVSTEKGLPQKLDAKAPLWSVDVPGPDFKALRSRIVFFGADFGI